MLSRLLRASGAPGHIVREQRLWWMPYWEVRAKLVGWQVYQRRKEIVARPRSSMDGATEIPESLVERERVEELVSRDVASSMPACDPREVGRLGISDRVEHRSWRSFSAREAEIDAQVCSVVLPHLAAVQRTEHLHSTGLAPKDASGLRQRLSLIRVRSRLLYYPVWRLEIEIGGRPGIFALDGLDGTVLSGRAMLPARGRSGLWLGACAASGWLAGAHPALGALSMAIFAVQRAREDGVRGDAAAWGGWLSAELDPQPLRSTLLSERDIGGSRWD
jgi:hypothetical protein